MTNKQGTADPIRGAIKVLMAYREVTQAEMLLGAGLPKSSFIRRMQVGGWTVAEVQTLAAYFGVGVGSLITGPNEVMRELAQRGDEGNRYRPTTEQSSADNSLTAFPQMADAA